MYYVPDGTKRAGLYECGSCDMKFLDLKTEPEIECPFCGKDLDWEIGPDEDMEVLSKTAKLIEVIEGEDVERYDTLLSLAITGGDFSWV